ncbi:MAG: hypothetical protein AB8B92_04500 [Gammaproteobacteria bacterium]
MWNKINLNSFCIFLCTTIFACNGHSELSPFSSDGCSLFPDSFVITKKDWCECCFQHDVAYWQGGTELQREQADVKLKQCVLQKTGNEALSKLMYDGVRVGGSPYFYNWYRWGYGWSYERKYQALTEHELEQVKRLTEQYLISNKNNYCDTR